MQQINSDERSAERRRLDEEIAAEPELALPDVPADSLPSSMESHLRQISRPVAIAGVVENGAVKPLDSSVILQEHSRVIIVASETLQ